MAIQLWSRKEGIVRPPAVLLHAEPGSSGFPETARTRLYRWMLDSFKSLEWGTGMGEVINHVEHSVESLYDGLRSAYGRQLLAQPITNPTQSGATWQLRNYVQRCDDVEVVNFVDAVMQVVTPMAGDEQFAAIGAALERVFAEEGIGYRWAGGQIVRTDGEVTHEQAIKPALTALAAGEYGAAREEFDTAVSAFTRGDYRNTVVYAGAALESVLKVVTGQNGVAGELIKAARRQGKIAPYLGNSVEHVVKIIHAVPAARGEVAAHGLGHGDAADERVARFVLTTAAASIELIASAA